MLDSILNYINQNYGSKRGLWNAAKFALHGQIRGYAHLTKIDWGRVERLVFVCSGNICRSPLASAHAVQSGASSESFGLACGDDHPADPRAISFARRQGLSLAHHRTRNIRQYAPLPGDLIVGMEPAHLEYLKIYRGKGAQLTLAGLWLQKPTPYIHDPFSSPPEFFDKCEQVVLSAVDNLITGRGK